MPKANAPPEEDYLFNQCMDFLNNAPYNPEGRNASFMAIHTAVLDRKEVELKKFGNSLYPSLCDVCPEILYDWQLSPNTWSRYQMSFVMAIMQILKNKNQVTMSDGSSH